MKTLLHVLLIGALLPTLAFGQDTVIQGTVLDDQGDALPYANVQLAETIEGASTDLTGRFSFTTARTGSHVVRASMIGLEAQNRRVTLVPGDTLTLRFILRETLVTLDEAVVTASAYVTGETAEATLAPLEVVTTAGAAADLFLAIKTLPGTAMVDEGAGLFVRGGDVDEVVLLLDRATVAHPYKYESPTGGVFGTIPPFMVKGTYFSAGGFSARYGNALSGVLAMESQGMPNQRALNLNVGLAAASLGADVPLVPGRLGLRFTGNRSFTDALFRLNGQRDQFSITPRGADGNLSLHYSYRPTGQLKLFQFVSTDRLGVFVDEPSFEGTYRGSSTSTLTNLVWTDVLGDWFVQGSASTTRYQARQQLGILDFEPSDARYKVRFDAERPVTDRLSLRFGTEVEHAVNAFVGTFPEDAEILAPGAETLSFDERYTLTRTGGYVEADVLLGRRLVATPGVRTDHQGDHATVDPRLALTYTLGPSTRLQAAWGRYHQFASPVELSPSGGTPSLRPETAHHLVAGVHHQRDLLELRAEAYRKPYRALILSDDEGYVNAGTGRAQGLDVFAKYGAFLRTRVNGWISYSYLESERTQVRRLGRTTDQVQASAPFDITHSLTVVGKVRLFGFVSAGLTARLASGRPITPIVDAVPGDDQASYYLPVEGQVASERLPTFRRLDANLSYYLPFRGTHSATVYLAVRNVLDEANVLGYDYSADYQTRTPRVSTYGRSIYMGITISLRQPPPAPVIR